MEMLETAFGTNSASFRWQNSLCQMAPMVAKWRFRIVMYPQRWHFSRQNCVPPLITKRQPSESEVSHGFPPSSAQNNNSSDDSMVMVCKTGFFVAKFATFCLPGLLSPS